MRTALTITLLIFSNLINAQGLAFDNATYVIGKDTLVCKRMAAIQPRPKGDAAIEKRQNESAFLPLVEHNLDGYRECLTMPGKCDRSYKETQQSIVWAKGKGLETGDYEKELERYFSIDKEKADHIASIKRHRFDSLQVEGAKQNKEFDSLRVVYEKQRIEQQKEAAKMPGIRAESDHIMHCLSSPWYNYDNGKNEAKKASVVSVCYTNSAVAFFTLQTGVITFHVFNNDGVADTDKDGSYSYLYTSAESLTSPMGYYTLVVNHEARGNKIIVSFSISSKQGATYTFSSNGYAGSCDLQKYFTNK